ncbi:MAG: hypothetical protein LH660_19895 [Phormidesmis sp. CAN_BIN36]|nr:hypothetical protein [Phormidesmis sp. CAN_BIN36]
MGTAVGEAVVITTGVGSLVCVFFVSARLLPLMPLEKKVNMMANIAAIVVILNTPLLLPKNKY